MHKNKSLFVPLIQAEVTVPPCTRDPTTTWSPAAAAAAASLSCWVPCVTAACLGCPGSGGPWVESREKVSVELSRSVRTARCCLSYFKIDHTKGSASASSATANTPPKNKVLMIDQTTVKLWETTLVGQRWSMEWVYNLRWLFTIVIVLLFNWG